MNKLTKDPWFMQVHSSDNHSHDVWEQFGYTWNSEMCKKIAPKEKEKMQKFAKNLEGAWITKFENLEI